MKIIFVSSIFQDHILLIFLEKKKKKQDQRLKQVHKSCLCFTFGLYIKCSMLVPFWVLKMQVELEPRATGFTA